MNTHTHADRPDLAQLAYDTTETAHMLGMQPWNVRELCRSGRLRYRHTGRRYIIPRSAIEEFLSGSDDPIAHPDSTSGRRSA